MEFHKVIHLMFANVLLLTGFCYSNPANSGQCPTGMSIIRNFMSPCSKDLYGCPKRPETECRDNYCNTDSGNWFVTESGIERRLTRMECCEGANDCTGVSCGSDKCTNYPEAVCEVNPCGESCGLRWFLRRERTLNGETWTDYIDVSNKCGVPEAVSGFSPDISHLLGINY